LQITNHQAANPKEAPSSKGGTLSPTFAECAGASLVAMCHREANFSIPLREQRMTVSIAIVADFNSWEKSMEGVVLHIPQLVMFGSDVNSEAKTVIFVQLSNTT
jgi:hypothetical protein